MADLNEQQILLIDRMANRANRKTAIASTIHCSTSTVYRHLDKLHPAGGSFGAIKLRKRKTGRYKCPPTKYQEIKDYVLAHRRCTLKEIIGGCSLRISSVQTMSNFLKDVGIGTYIAVTNQFLDPANKAKRCVSKIIAIIN